MKPFEIINIEIIQEKYLEEFEEWTEYLPFELVGIIDRDKYYERWSDEAKRQYKQTRQGMPSDNVDEYLINDILDWVEEYPQFKDIILWDKIKENKSE